MHHAVYREVNNELLASRLFHLNLLTVEVTVHYPSHASQATEESTSTLEYADFTRWVEAQRFVRADTYVM